MIVRRLAKLARLDAVHAVTGESFGEVAARRASEAATPDAPAPNEASAEEPETRCCRVRRRDDAAHPMANLGIVVTVAVGGYIYVEGPVILLHAIPNFSHLRTGERGRLGDNGIAAVPAWVGHGFAIEIEI